MKVALPLRGGNGAAVASDLPLFPFCNKTLDGLKNVAYTVTLIGYAFHRHFPFPSLPFQE